MRTVFVAVVLLAGCRGGDDKNGRAPKATAAVPAGAVVPKVGAASVLAVDEGQPVPLLVLVDDPTLPAPKDNLLDMPVRIASATSWADLAKQDPAAGAKPTTLDIADKVAREGVVLGESPEAAIKAWLAGPVPLDVPAQDPTAFNQDDPPPPPPDDDESGGTGTAMALEEGKMGHGPAKPSEPRPIADRGGLVHFDSLGGADEDANPTRLADVAGEVMTDGKLGAQIIAVLATPRTNAQRLARVLSVVEGELVVAHDGTVRPLRLNFTRTRDAAYPEDDRWLEVRVTKQGLAVEAVPDVPLAVSDPTQLGAAIDKARASRKLAPTAPVDLLVEPDADAQHLVDLLVTLDTAGVRVIGIGAAPAPDSDEAKRRGHRNPTFHLGRPNSVGDLDKKVIRDTVAAAKPQLFACYTASLAKQPELTGTVQTQFFITPKGNVAAAEGTGVDPDVAKCIADAIKKLEFPKPKGAGGVQVNFPFSMRP